METETRAVSLVFIEEKSTRVQVTRRGRALGIMSKIIDGASIERDSKIRLQHLKDLRTEVGNIEITEEGGALEIFCGAQKNADNEWVARAYVRQKLSMEGDGQVRIEVGVESVPDQEGISRHWFLVDGGLVEGDLTRLVGLEVDSEGKIIFLSGETGSCEVSRLGESGKKAIVAAMERMGVPGKVLVLAADIRFVKKLMSSFAKHELGNPYRPWRREKIWKKLLEVS